MTRFLYSTLCILFLSLSLSAQSTDTSPETGEKPLGSYFKTDIDSVSLSNGNLHLSIPVFTLPGREAPIAFSMQYDSQYYERRQLYWNGTTWVYGYESKAWRKNSSFIGGALTATKTYATHSTNSMTWSIRFVWASPGGRRYVFPTYRQQSCSSISQSGEPPNVIYYCVNPSPADSYLYDNLQVYTTDGQYTRLSTNTYFSNPWSGTPAFISFKDGTRRDGVPYGASGNVTVLTTTNGNQLTVNTATQTITNLQAGLGDYISTTLGRSIGYTSTDTYTYTTTETITLQDANGQSQVYVIQWKLVHGAYSLESQTPLDDDLKLVDYIQLPNGKRYTFEYNAEGMVSKVILPSGAYIRYEYEHPGCNTRAHVARRFVSADGTSGAEKQTSYTYTYTSTMTGNYCGGNPTYVYGTMVFPPVVNATVTGPDGTQTKHLYDYNGMETSSLTISNNEIVNRVDRTFGIVWVWDAITNHPIHRLTSETTTMGSALRKTQYTYDSYNNITKQEDFDWGTHVPGARLRYVDKTYNTSASACTGGSYICNRVTSEKTYTDAGTLVAQTDYEYDNYQEPNALVSRSGTIPGWTSPSGSRGNLTHMKQWLNTTSSWLTTIQQYDVLGNKVKVTDPGGHATNTDFTDRFDVGSTNTFAYPTKVTDPSGFYVETTYDFNTGLVEQTKDSLNRTTTKTYDGMNRELQTDYPNGGFTRYTYNDTALTAKKEIKVDTAGNLGTMISHFDGLYREIQKETYDPEGTIYVETQYDAKGRKWKVSNPRRSAETAIWTQFAYDALDRPTITTAPDNSTVQYAYNGNQTTVTDEAGNQRRYTYDGLGRITMVEEPNPSLATPLVTTYAYDVLGKMTQSNQSGQIRSWAFDSLGRTTTQTLPESGMTSFTYNAEGLLSTKTDARNITTTITYHSTHVHQIGSRSYSDATPAVSVNYNSQGLRSSMTDGLGSVSYSYDSNTDRLTQEARTLTGVSGTFTTSYVYNVKGDLTSMTYPSGRVVNFNYATGGGCCNSRLSSVADQTTGATMANAMTFNAAGELLTRTLNPGTDAIQQSFTYNDRLQLSGIAASAGLITLMNFTYNYGTSTTNTGRVLSRIDGVQPEHSLIYGYDSVYRLSQAVSQDSQWDISWAFDVWGNRTGQTPRGFVQSTGKVGTQSFSYQQTGGVTNNRQQGMTYDSAGNVTNDGAPTPHNYTFNAENQITQMDGGAAVYAYDGEGRRMKKTVGSETTYYFYGPGGLLCEFSTSNALSAATSAASTDKTTYRTSDKLGSAVLIINSAGLVIENNRTLPYGEAWIPEGSTPPPSTNEKKFTTYQRDSESGLDYAMNRYYTNASGRFTAVDRLGAGWHRTPLEAQPNEMDTMTFSPLFHVETFGIGAELERNPSFEFNRDADFSAVGGMFDWRAESASMVQAVPTSLNRYLYTEDDPINSTDPQGTCTRRTGATVGFIIGAVAGGIAGGISSGGVGVIPGAIVGGLGGALLGVLVCRERREL